MRLWGYMYQDTRFEVCSHTFKGMKIWHLELCSHVLKGRPYQLELLLTSYQLELLLTDIMCWSPHSLTRPSGQEFGCSSFGIFLPFLLCTCSISFPCFIDLCFIYIQTNVYFQVALKNLRTARKDLTSTERNRYKYKDDVAHHFGRYKSGWGEERGDGDDLHIRTLAFKGKGGDNSQV